jgi:HAD superfamily hydrolase (TIGR01509 family)
MLAPRLARRPAALILDMDGLLLDTERLALNAWSEAAAALGVPFDPSLALRMTGRNHADCDAMVRAHYPTDYPVDALLGTWNGAYDAIVAREGVRLKPGVLELLAWLDARRLPRVVATSTRRERARAALERAQLWPRMHGLVGGDEVARSKPAPDIYFEAARISQTPPARCLIVEDSETGMNGALAAGIAAVMVPDLHLPSTSLAATHPVVVKSLFEVIELLDGLPE